MRNSKLTIAVVLSTLLYAVLVFAQANKTNSGDLACSASGSSTQVLAARSSRFAYTINNTSGLDIRIGYLDSGTANLTTSNSWLLKAGQPFTDSAPGVSMNRVMCMSTTGATATISFLETYK